MKIYARDDLVLLTWPESADGQYARRFLTPLVQEGTLKFFDNIDAEIRVLEANGRIFPIVLGNLRPESKNSYVASPMSHYVDYGREEIRIELHKYPYLRAPLKPLIDVLEHAYRLTSLDQVLLVNNWLLSTNLYPAFNVQLLRDMTELLTATFPDRPIVFRSVNPILNQEVYQQLLSLKYVPVFSRQVYLLDPAKGTYLQKESYRGDLRIQKRSAYRWEEYPSPPFQMIVRLKALYDDLYLQKYSTLNPQFNTRFFETALEQDWLKISWLRHPDKELPDALLGWLERDGIMTAPMVGYDRSLPEKLGLYRLTTLKLLQEAVNRNVILHQSSGASKFKMHRGAQPSMEYNMVYYRHCAGWRRLPWQSLQLLTDKLLVPMMEQLGL